MDASTDSSTSSTNQASTPLEKPSQQQSNTDLARHTTHEDLKLPPTTYPSHQHHQQQHDDLDLTRTKSIAQSLSPLHEFLFVTLLCCTQFVTQVGLFNTLNILHTIGPALGITSPGVLSWLVAGYSLTVGTFILLSGRCGDMFGYKPMVIIGFAWFALWNVVAGCSVYADGNGEQVLFIFARVLSGIGPALMLPNALGLLGVVYRNGRKKDMVFSLFGSCAPSGAVVGQLVSGALALAWWPWTFWSFGITLAILAVLSAFILPSVPLSPEVRGLTLRQRISELDLLGATIGITAMILFNFAWNQAPGFGWEEPYIYVLLIVGILLFAVFFYFELKVAKNPLLPFGSLSTDVSFVLTCVGCGWASFGIWAYYFWQILQEMRGVSPLLTSAQLVPTALMGFVAAVTTGKVISRIGPGWVMLISMIAFLIGSILTATMPVHQTYWKQAFVTVMIIPWGMDMSFPAGTLIMSDAVEKRHQGMAASLVSTVVNYSISIGVGIAGTVDVQVNRGGTTRKDELRGYRGAMYMGIGLSGLGVFTSLLFLAKMHLRERKAARTQRTEKKDGHVEA
ncbi:major facilitator superfamily-domain-containing protein [Paraphoma chrysanthemicola]|uniref:Major facilitator superfamily-domain-containing protein n=1 Tax=Paraphoma chrysanthemicola TaxID=798071 RepID=A0A8K0R5Q3_9PLEO|nr:major facilitator superfamily-domain-containing protein [Paraphoma chrysanthemicola]